MTAVVLLTSLITFTVGFNSAFSQSCGRTYFDGYSGTIQSPNYPSEYPNGLNCNYTVAVPSAMSVNFRFNAFQTEECCDRLTFSCVTGAKFGPMNFQGVSQLSTLSIPSCRRVNLVFVTDGSSVRTGFSISYSFVTDLCGPTYFDGYSGTIQSPNYPSPYPSGLNCNYSVVVPPGMSVNFRFKDFETEQCCDYLTFSCVTGTMFGPTTFKGRNQSSIMFIPSCRQVNLFFFTDPGVQRTGFSLSFTFVSGIVGRFIIKPSNVFLQVDTAVVSAFTFNCTSSSGFFPWWSNNRQSDGYNETVTNGFCNVSSNYRSKFSSESLGTGSCNLIAIAQARSYQKSVFVCNYGTSASAGALLVPINPGLVISNENVSASTIKDLAPKIDDELKFTCGPRFVDSYRTTFLLSFYLLGQPVSNAVQVRFLSTYWTDETGTILSRESSSYTSTIVVKSHSHLGVFPSHNCNIEVQLLSNISHIDNSTPAVMTLSVQPFQVSFGPAEGKMSLSGSERGQITRGGVLSCYAPAYPPATYKWTNEGNGQLVSGPSIVVTQSGQYTCAASNFFNNRFHSDFKTITVEVSEQRLLSIIGVAIGVTSLLINMILIVLLFRRCRKTTAEAVRNQDNSRVDAVRLEPVGRQVNDYASQKEDNDDDLYANDFQCDQNSTRSSATSDYEAVDEIAK